MSVVLNRLKEIASAVMYAAEAPELEQVLERIAEVARELAQTRYAALGVPDPKGGVRFFKTSGMTPHEVAMMEHPPYGHGLIGAILRERQSLRLTHITDDPRSVGFPEHHPHMDSLLGVPIQIGGQLFGVLYLCDRVDGQPFTEQDQLLIEMLAGYAALAIAGAEISSQRSRLKLLEERQRIGMELHDGIIQSLYGIGMQIDLLRNENEQSYATFSPIVYSLNGVIEDIRAYIQDLSYRGGTQFTIYDCLARMPERLNLPSEMQIEIHAPHEKPPFAPAVFESICLIVSEALSNAARHSGADKITLTSEKREAWFVLTVSDNGKGFDPKRTSNHGGLGLHNMQQRARLYGGRVMIDSQPEQGTTLTIQIPIRAY